MSSSRRSLPNNRSRKGAVCPTCGKKRVVELREDVTLQIGNRSHRFRRVHHERCEACGERIFGLEASKAFDAAVLKTKGRSAA